MAHKPNNPSKLARLLDSALQHIHRGEFPAAQQFCQEALHIAPRNPHALHLLGISFLQQGNPRAALDSLQRAAAIEPGHHSFQANLGYCHIALEQFQQARAAFEKAHRLDAGDQDVALALANCLGMLGEPVAAEKIFRNILTRRPGDALLCFNLANTLKDQQRYDEALEYYARATALAPRFAEAHCNRGVVLHKLGQFEAAVQAYHECLRLKEDFTPALAGLAATLNSLRHHREAEAACREALKRNPREQNAWPLLGKALMGQSRWQEAVPCFEQATREFPDSSDAWADFGWALTHVGRINEAFQALDAALGKKPVSSSCHYFRATALFSVGRLADAATYYSGRNDHTLYQSQHPERPLAEQLPVMLAGESISLLGEQGIGDELFFLRYAPLLHQQGAHITYLGHPKLASLLARHPALGRIASDFNSLGDAKLTALVGDLPRLTARLQTSALPAEKTGNSADPARPPYPALLRVYWPEPPKPLRLSPQPERVIAVRERLRQLGPPPYIGLTWRAGTRPEEQRGNLWTLFKEIPQSQLAPILRGIEGTLISLQRKPLTNETAQLAAMVEKPVHDLSAVNEDLEEMLALLSVLDHYIGVSNTNMHLRAATGHPAHVLVPWPAEWRWLNVGARSPWFPDFHIYRQQVNGSWTAALTGLRARLEQTIPLAE